MKQLAPNPTTLLYIRGRLSLIKGRMFAFQAICLEDLRPKGFVMRDRMKQMDFPHASLAFKALGRLHALSFALRDQRPEIFQKKIANLQEAFFSPESVNNQLLIDRFEAFRELVKTVMIYIIFSEALGELV